MWVRAGDVSLWSWPGWVRAGDVSLWSWSVWVRVGDVLLWSLHVDWFSVTLIALANLPLSAFSAPDLVVPSIGTGRGPG